MLSYPLRGMKMCPGLYIDVFFFFNSNKSDAGAGLVDLPHVQLLVFLQGLLELGGGEATRNAALLRFGHADHSASSTAACRTLCGELTHQREDDIGRPLSPKHKVRRLDLADWKNTRLLLVSTLPCLFVHLIRVKPVLPHQQSTSVVTRTIWEGVNVSLIHASLKEQAVV